MTSFVIRPLTAKDVAPMARIVSKIGVREFKGILSAESIGALVEGAVDDEGRVDLAAAGIMIDAAGIVLANYDKAEDDLLAFLASVSGMTKKAVGELPLADFAELLVSVFKSDGFSDFFTRVSSLL